jgi:hypothetical protein
MEVNADYYTIVEGGAFRDAANNLSPFDQFNTADFWNFTTETALVLVSTNPSAGQITMNMNTDPTVTVGTPADFTVTDGIGNVKPVTAVNDLTGNNFELVVDLSTAVGDLTIDFDGKDGGGLGDTDINAGVGTLQDFTGVNVNFDTTDPTMTISTTDGIDGIILTFNDDVFNAGSVPSDWSVVDGGANNYTVTAITDSTTNAALVGNQIELSFATIASPSGDLFVTYTDNVGNDGVQDYGGNELATQTIDEELDGIAPKLTSTTIIDNTTIRLTFDEPVQIISSSPANAFTVTDENLDTYIVAAVSDAIASDNELELTTQSTADAFGDITVDFTSGLGLDIKDFGDNSLGISSITMDVNYNPIPTVVEIFAGPAVGVNAIGDTDQGDVSDGSGVGMYRTNASVAVATVQAFTPITITPRDVNHVITIYSDAGLTDIVYQTAAAGPITPTLSDIFETTVPTFFSDGTDDNGVYTFYITETTAGASLTETFGATEGEAISYSIALLDDISNSASGQSFGETDDIGTNMQLSNPTSQSLVISGNGVSDIKYNDPIGTSSARFVPLAAGIGSHQISFEWENDTTGVNAVFNPGEFAFVVNASSDVFLPSQALAFGKTSGEALVDMNNVLTGLDVGEIIDDTDPDFYGYEVYHIVDGSIVTGIGGPNINSTIGTTVFTGSLYQGGSTTNDIASIVLGYDGILSSNGDNRIAFADGAPAFVQDEWTFNPSAFDAAFNTGSLVDTLRIVSISQADGGGSKAVICVFVS